MWNKQSLIVLLTGFVMLYACTKDFIETDLKDKKVTLVAPADKDTVSTASNIFWWDKIEGTIKYNLQIAKPYFSSIQQLVLDTNVAEDHFGFTLAPGTYQWRVKAYNGSSETEYTVRTLVIDSTSNLTGQTLLLISPAANYITKSTNPITFKWDTLYNADDYRLQIFNDSSGSTELDVIVLSGSFSYPLGEGEYTWQVRAQNATSNTLYSSRTFTIDITAPPVSVPTFPADGGTISKPDTLLWARSAEAVGDSVFIYSDSLLSASVYKGYTINTSYVFTGTIGQNYFWRLRSADAVGNWSNYGTTRKFLVQ